MITVSDWLAKRMYDLGYLYKLDKSQIPNVEHNLIPQLQHPPADPNRDFTVPWQAGMTGLIVNTDLAPNVTSICDLFDPQYKGKVTMLTELRDSVPMTLKCMGIDPDKATEAQWLSAVDKIKAGEGLGPDPRLHRQRLHPRALQRRHRDRPRLVRRRGPAPGRQPEHQVRDAQGGLHVLVDEHGDPAGRLQSPGRREVHELRLRPAEPGADRPLGQLRHAGRRRQADLREDRPRARQRPADLPEHGVHEELHVRAGARPGRWATGSPRPSRQVITG